MLAQAQPTMLLGCVGTAQYPIGLITPDSGIVLSGHAQVGPQIAVFEYLADVNRQYLNINRISEPVTGAHGLEYDKRTPWQHVNFHIAILVTASRGPWLDFRTSDWGSGLLVGWNKKRGYNDNTWISGLSQQHFLKLVRWNARWGCRHQYHHLHFHYNTIVPERMGCRPGNSALTGEKRMQLELFRHTVFFFSCVKIIIILLKKAKLFELGS